jgi:hypothetical protein
MYRQRKGFGWRQAVPEASIGQQRPDVAKGYVSGKVLDVHAAISQRSAVPIWFSDLGVEGDHALQPRLEARGGICHQPVQRSHAVLLA